MCTNAIPSLKEKHAVARMEDVKESFWLFSRSTLGMSCMHTLRLFWWNVSSTADESVKTLHGERNTQPTSLGVGSVCNWSSRHSKRKTYCLLKVGERVWWHVSPHGTQSSHLPHLHISMDFKRGPQWLIYQFKSIQMLYYLKRDLNVKINLWCRRILQLLIYVYI